ncbi:hypothetical protein [Mycolicibacterium sp. 624]|uniref:hypothetical protein n=1 Tax=Mycolicibacterium sp. 624 TaxID=3156314 RepID=UPI0033972D08
MTDKDASTETTEVMGNPPTTEVPEETQPQGDISDAAPEVSDPGDDTDLSRRDIRYREQLRAAEAERDALRQNVETMQRREVERLAAEHLTKPAALWTVGVELASLVGEDGTVDADRVLAAAQDARQQLGLEDPQARVRRGPVVPREGTSVQSGGNSGSWTEAFKR